MDLILASASPRRAALLAQAGWTFQALPVDIEEDLAKDKPVKLAVMDLALRKARACPVEQGLVIAADTVVVLNGEVLGKPHSAQEAVAMLHSLSGRQHTVITAVAVLNSVTGEYETAAEHTIVYFRSLKDREIEDYVRSGEPVDKAGAYGIQGKGALLVERINGCYNNVVGLPLARLAAMLAKAGYPHTYTY